MKSIQTSLVAALTAALLGLSIVPAGATPVCTDGYMGGPPLSSCGGRVFPEVENSVDYVQYLPDPATGFREYQHGLEYLETLYPRWISVFTLSEYFEDERAVSAGPDRIRSFEDGDTGDGGEILVVKLTDHTVNDRGKETMLFSLSVHGDEKGGIEGGVRVVEDLAMAATSGGTISDGVAGYRSTTGRRPRFHEYEVKSVLKKEVVYFIDFNIDGWMAGDHFTTAPGPLYTRGNYMGTDLNRQMPTVGRINATRNPLEESEMRYGHRFMHLVADAGKRGRMAYGADIHGESQSRAWADIMYPAGQFDSVKHRQLMAIAERTKSAIDQSLFMGLVDVIEENTGGDGGEGIEDYGAPPNTVPTKPARWGTVWDTLGYTDTGFIGDYLAEELGVTGMDYEIALNHADVRAHSRPWAYFMQENMVNTTRAIVKTAMAYALYQSKEFANFKIDPKGRVGYVFNPEVVTDADGAGTLPGPAKNGVSANGKKVRQRHYRATNMAFFRDTAKYVEGGLTKVHPADIAASPLMLDAFDTVVLADITAPKDAQGRAYSADAYYRNLNAWVLRGGNLVLTDRALHVLGKMGVVGASDVSDILVYQPYANFTDFTHPMLKGLRPNARQLSEATLVGYGIGDEASPMTVVATSAWEGAGGTVVGTTGPGDGGSDDGTLTSVGELELGRGKIRIMGGGLPIPYEGEDHRYGLKNYSLTYSGLYIMENSMIHDSEDLGPSGPRVSRSDAAQLPGMGLVLLLPLAGVVVRRVRRRVA
ncbi:MAG TPA: M14 family zinc carboxypeptidase [Actinomycetota bacterium]|nr:M14 family zinc carboxypeptidase [Actinomycetota bacterium]